MADWYYAKNGKQNGPINSAELRQLAQSGQLLPEDLVFREGGTNWVAASTVNGLFPAPGAAMKVTQQPIGGGGGGYDFDGGGAREPDGRAPRGVSQGGGKGNYWVDLIMFRRMIAPTIIIILFWLGVAGTLILALVLGIMGLITMTVRDGLLPGMGIVVLALVSVPINILVVRLYCELLIVIFRINDSLMDIKESFDRQQKT